MNLQTFCIKYFQEQQIIIWGTPLLTEQYMAAYAPVMPKNSLLLATIAPMITITANK